MKNLQSAASLHNGVKMPWLGLGVFKVQDGEEVVQSVKSALKAGYKSIDTAAVYQNEEGVGQAIKEAGIPRKELLLPQKFGILTRAMFLQSMHLKPALKSWVLIILTFT